MDRELLKEISAVSEFYEDISIDGNNLSLIFTGMNGVYIWIEGNSQHTELYATVKKKLGLKDGQLFLFEISDGDSGSFYDYINGFVSMKNIYAAYENCYANHLIPQAVQFHISFESPASYCEMVELDEVPDNDEDADSYIVPVIPEKQLVAVEKKLISILEEPVLNGQYRIYPDGHMEVKRTVTQSIAGISTFMETGTVYYPCMDMDGDKFFLLTFLGGWFGIHKFKTGNYLKGLFYALTCGCCGVFYVLDLLSIILGGYNYSMVSADKSSGTVSFQKKKYYSRPLQHKLRAIVLTLVAVVISFLLVKFLYVSVLEHVNVFISSLLSDTEFADNLVNLLDVN
jgi:TM2 domain-containing membrane protein YozV